MGDQRFGRGVLIYGSLFSGIEAASVAWEPLGWRPAWFSEIEPFPCAVLDHYWPDVPNLGDITATDFAGRAKAMGPVDLVVGGSPCQAFSVAGLRESLDDDRGNLTLRYVEIIHALKPTWIVWENVPGVLNTKDSAFGCFLAGLAEADAPLESPGGSWPTCGLVSGERYNLAWVVKDAQFFGVPQRRRRVFVVGSLGNWGCAEALFPVCEGLPRNPAESGKAGEDVAGTLSARTKVGGGLGTDMDLSGGLVAGTLPATYTDQSGKALGEMGNGVVVSSLNAHPGRYDYETETFVTHALSARYDSSEDGSGRGVPIIPILEVGKRCGKKADKRDGLGIGQPGGPMFSLQGGAQHAVAVNIRGREGGGTAEVSGQTATALRASQGGGDKLHVLCDMAVRRLTPTECERLQGFPDGHTNITYGRPRHPDQICPDGPRYKALGNSMAVPVMRWIGQRIDLVAREIKKAGEEA